METPIRMADLGGIIIFGNTHIKGCDLKTSTTEASDIEQTRKKTVMSMMSFMLQMWSGASRSHFTLASCLNGMFED